MPQLEGQLAWWLACCAWTVETTPSQELPAWRESALAGVQGLP